MQRRGFGRVARAAASWWCGKHAGGGMCLVSRFDTKAERSFFYLLIERGFSRND